MRQDEMNVTLQRKNKEHFIEGKREFRRGHFRIRLHVVLLIKRVIV